MCVGLEGSTKVGKQQEALCDIISAVFGTSLGGLSLGFHQAWQISSHLNLIHDPSLLF
jgi:hypothetical protein